jgi:hypothetical protein
MNWLKSEEYLIKIDNELNGALFFIKIPRNDILDFIYCHHNYLLQDLHRENFEYVGIYDKRNGQLRDVQYRLMNIVSDGYSRDNFKEAGSDFQNEVRNKINTIINNDRSNLSIHTENEIQSQCYKRDLQYAKEYKELEEVRRLFLSGKMPYDIVFTADFSYGNFSEDSYIDYIMNSEELINNVAKKWIAENQEKMLLRFLINDIIKEELQTMINNTESPLQLIKTIMNVMKETDCKTVNVTVIINEVELTFKTAADIFRRDCGNYYSTWDIVASDRKKFEKLYGKYANYTAKDIIKITTGKKILYQNNDKK